MLLTIGKINVEGPVQADAEVKNVDSCEICSLGQAYANISTLILVVHVVTDPRNASVSSSLEVQEKVCA